VCTILLHFGSFAFESLLATNGHSIEAFRESKGMLDTVSLWNDESKWEFGAGDVGEIDARLAPWTTRYEVEQLDGRNGRY